MTSERWLEIAFGELADAVAEAPGSRDAERIVEYHSVTAGGESPDAVAWCSSFACWVLEQAGIRSPRSKWARSWLAWPEGGDLTLARLGAITVLARGEPGSNQGHVGFLLCTRPGRVAILGGNQHDRVSVEWFPADRVIGFRWPKGVL